MLKIVWPKIITGQLQIMVKGKEIGSFLDHVVQAGIPLEDVIWLAEDQLSLTIHLRHFFPIYRTAKMYKLRTRIERRIGFPFFLKRVKKRKFFAVGALLFFVILTTLSSFVWKVDIEGNKQIPTEQVLTLLKEYGVYPGQLRVRVPEAEKVQYEIHRMLPQTSWIGMRIEGTKVVVTVVEKRQIEKNKEERKREGKFDLIAKKDAMIYGMKVTYGNPLVKVNDVVKKGQILVSGNYGGSEGSVGSHAVGSNGTVLGRGWYESEVRIPIKLTRKEYTGAHKESKFLFFGSYILRNPFSDDPFSNWEAERQVRPLRIGSWEIPIGLVTEDYREMKVKAESRSIDQATLIGLEQSRADLLRQLGKDGKILEEKILHRSVENGKVYLKIHFDAIENIAVAEPLG